MKFLFFLDHLCSILLLIITPFKVQYILFMMCLLQIKQDRQFLLGLSSSYHLTWSSYEIQVVLNVLYLIFSIQPLPLILYGQLFNNHCNPLILHIPL